MRDCVHSGLWTRCCVAWIIGLAVTFSGCTPVVVHVAGFPNFDSEETESVNTGELASLLSQSFWTQTAATDLLTSVIHPKSSGFDPRASRWTLKLPDGDPDKPSARRSFDEQEWYDENRDAVRALAQEESLAGWNAAILLARNDPANADRVVSTLERLVCSPPLIPEESMAERARLEPEEGFGKSTTESSKRLLGNSNDRRRTAWKTDRRLPLTMRCAAAAAWCRALTSMSDDESDPMESLRPAGRALELAELPVLVQGELMRSLSASVAPALIPGVEEALAASPEAGGRSSRAHVDLRRAAIEACLIHAVTLRENTLDEAPAPSRIPHELAWDESLWPVSALDARTDPDARVRRTLGRWMAVANAPVALKSLRAQISDSEIRVREDALLSLGVLQSDAARDELKKQFQRPEERVREFAARGLGEFGPRELAPLAKDPAGSVRRAVAESLARYPSRESAVLLKGFVTDGDSQIQLRAVEATNGWPRSFATPVLLAGLRDGARLTRQACWQALNEREELDDDFDVDAPADQRRMSIDRLVAAHNLPVGLLEPQSTAARSTSSPDRRQQIGRVVRELTMGHPETSTHQEAWRQAQRWTAEDVPQIERELLSLSAPSSGFVERELLPKLSRAHAAVGDLENTDVFLRRRGAQTLSELSQQSSLSPLVVRRLSAPMAREQDQLVWRYAMHAVASDGTPEAARVVEYALNSNWPDIRVLGCDYVRRHGQASYAVWLLPLLSDANRNVQLAAVAAAGVCGNPVVLDGLPARSNAPAQPGIRALLSAPEPRVQFAAAAAMSRLGDPQGMSELARLAFHESATTREDAVRVMGDSGQMRFVEPLIRLGWTESTPRVRRAVLESLDRLVPPEKRPQLGSPATEDGMIRNWMEWQQKTQGGTSAS